MRIPGNAQQQLPARGRLGEIARSFLRLGLIAFGGPAAHIALMHEEFVNKRRWVEEQHFLDLLGATNLIPGPNSTEMTIHLGFVRGGWRGLLLAGVCFITPAFLVVTAFSWAYVRFGKLPAVEWLLYGVKPVVIAVILQALWSLGTKALKSLLTAAAGTAVLVLYFFDINTILLLLGGGAAVMAIQNWKRLRTARKERLLCNLPLFGLPALAAQAASVKLPLLFFTFLKIGSVLYGSGYVLLAFLRADFVAHLGWLSDRQLLDAVAIGQVTPGPVFTTATFIGYILAGIPGAFLATVGIFLPAFVFVALSNPLIPKLRQSTWTGAFLDGVNATALGLMAAVTFDLARVSFIDPVTVVLGILSAVLLFRFKVNSSWLIGLGAAAGLISSLFR